MRLTMRLYALSLLLAASAGLTFAQTDSASVKYAPGFRPHFRSLQADASAFILAYNTGASCDFGLFQLQSGRNLAIGVHLAVNRTTIGFDDSPIQGSPYLDYDAQLSCTELRGSLQNTLSVGYSYHAVSRHIWENYASSGRLKIALEAKRTLITGICGLIAKIHMSLAKSSEPLYYFGCGVYVGWGH